MCDCTPERKCEYHRTVDRAKKAARCWYAAVMRGDRVWVDIWGHVFSNLTRRLYNLQPGKD